MSEINNTGRVFLAFYNAMMDHYRKDREAEAFLMAEDLLKDAELPLLIRARCHMVLSTNDEHPYYLWHAQEAVRVLDEDCRSAVVPEAFPQKQYEEAQRLLEAAQEASEEETDGKADGKAVGEEGGGENDHEEDR